VAQFVVKGTFGDKLQRKRECVGRSRQDGGAIFYSAPHDFDVSQFNSFTANQTLHSEVAQLPWNEHVESISYWNGSKGFAVFGDSLIVILKYSEHDLIWFGLPTSCKAAISLCCLSRDISHASS
jgi:hypothetical protein